MWSRLRGASRPGRRTSRVRWSTCRGCGASTRSAPSCSSSRPVARKRREGSSAFSFPRAWRGGALLARSGIERLLAGAYRADGPWPEAPGGEAEIDLVEVKEEEGVGRLVDGLSERLLDRFPLGESGTRLLAQAMLELLQNIPQHASPEKADVSPFGVGALQEF